MGFACAKALLEHGAKGLVIFDVNPEQSKAKVEELKQEFPEAKLGFQTVDITDDVAVAKSVENSAQFLGSIDSVLCFAGVVGCTHAIEMTASQVCISPFCTLSSCRLVILRDKSETEPGSNFGLRRT